MQHCKKALLTVIAALIVIIIVVGAVVVYVTTFPSVPSKTQQSIQLTGIKTPVWSQEDLQATKLMKANTRVTVHDVQHLLKLPFYSGSVPFFYKEGKYSSFGIEQTVYHDFGSFKTDFIYGNAVTIIGVRTVDNDGSLLAEVCNITYHYGENDTAPIVFTEIHYGSDGQPVFSCASQIEGGQKIAETNIIGTKTTEYYFLWPDT